MRKKARTEEVKKRIFSLLLALCLMAGLIPAAAFAVVPEEALYAQMLDLGIVDADGTLIEDNTFTVSDGTRLYSLTELIEWLNQCGNSDLGKVVTVDKTGKSATVENLIYALLIENQIAEVAGQLKLLASGSYAATLAAGTGAVPSYVHNMQLAIQMERSGSIATMKVVLCDKNNGTACTAPYNIPVEVGAFADFIDMNNANYAADGGQVPGTNRFQQFTIPAGSSYIEFKMDLAKLRTDYLSRQEGLLAGNTFVLFQARTVAGTSKMPDSSAEYIMKIAYNDDVDPIVGALTFDKIVIGMQDSDTMTIVPYCQNWGVDDTMTDKVTIDGKNYFKIPIRFIYAKDSAYDDNQYYGWMQTIGRASKLGMGDAQAMFNLEHVTLWTNSARDNPIGSAPTLYVDDGSGLVPVGENATVYNPDNFQKEEDAADYLLEVLKAQNKSWTEPSSGFGIEFSTNYQYNVLRYDNVQVPFESYLDHHVNYPLNWYLNEDWCTQNKDANIRPGQLIIHGAMTLVDNTAPTIKSIDTCARTLDGAVNYVYSDFYPGDFIPIVVTFSEPVYGDYELVYQVGTGWESLSSSRSGDGVGDVLSDEGLLSNTRVFYYKVDSTDCTEIQVLGVKPASDFCMDVFGNTFEKSPGADYQIKSVALLEGHILGGQLKQSLQSLTAAPDAQDPCKVNFRVELDNDQTFKTQWGNWSGNPAVTVRVDNDTSLSVPLTLNEENNQYFLTGTMTLPEVSANTTHMVELYYGNQFCYGVYTTFEQKPVMYAGADAYTIGIDGSWQSGIDNMLFLQDEDAPILRFTDNGTAYSYKYLGTDDLVWTVDHPEVVQLSGNGQTLTQAPSVSIIATGVGTATISLRCSNNQTTSTTASNSITITVKDSGSPSLLFPKSANTIYARIGMDQTVHFSSNLAQHAPAGGKITASLYTGSSIDPYAEPIWETTLERSATSLTIPGGLLNNISKGDNASYVLRLTATAQVDSNTLNLSTNAYIIVRSQPAVITLLGLENPTFTHDQSIPIGWMVENFDLDSNPEDCQFQFTVEKDGNIIYSTTDKSTFGSFTLIPAVPDQLKDYYIVTAKAKNGADPTWSIASSTITVYKLGAMDIQIGGESRESVMLSNKILGGTTTAPVITTYAGKTIGGLTSAQAIAGLRSELSLMETISINYDDYNWSILKDLVKWSTSTGRGEDITDELQRAVSINYREGKLYSPLENYSYTYYLPETIMLLCGMRSGSNIISVQHKSLPALGDSVTVNVETLKNKLYLFQFTPAVRTEVSYEDGLGELHTLYTNDDGSLALFEPNGIASDLWAASVSSSGDSYRGTISNLALKRGEGNGTRGELYPLNAAELRLAAVAQVQLLTPDGEPLANTAVTLRGGVYRNRYAAANRDDAYCAGARFARAAGEAAALDGTKDQIFTTDENGMLTVHMDLSQFLSINNPEAVGVGDSLKFIFELRFGDTYYPEIVIVDGSLNSRDAMRSGEDIVTLTAARKAKPFVAVQTISYTGREIDVRRHTGVVGPSSNYPSAVLGSTIMLWGMTDVSLTDTGYHFDLRSQQTGVSVPRQQLTTAIDASYPFSSIPLLNNVVTIDSSSFASFDGTRKTPLEAALYNGSNSLVSTIALPFGIADLTTIEKVDESKSVISLMANIAAYGTVGGANTKYGLVNTVSDAIIGDALSFLEKMGGEAGLVKAILMPTADPTRYDAYLWTGINTMKLEDLEYDRNGVSLEPSYIGEDYDSLLGEVNDTFTLSDFQAMADGSYFDDRSSLYGAVANGVIAMPIMLQLEGWLTTEIRYNFDKGQWEVLTTGGGFTAGAQIEFEKALNLTVYGIPLTASFMVRGGAVVDFQTAVRYAEQLGNEWRDDTADKVNDYLTALRINAYFEFFGGVGFDKGFTAKIGVFGKIDINNENRFLTRKYLKNPNDRDMAGQFLQLDGEAGIKAALGVGPLVTEITVISLGFGTAWNFNEWEDIEEYWEEASSGLGNNWLGNETAGQSYSLFNTRSAVIASEPVVRLQSRDYLDEDYRIWLGGDNGIMLMSLDAPNKLAAIETNSYPFSAPMISDDGSILVYLSDSGSYDVEDIEVRYSLHNGFSFPDGTAIPVGADGFSGYGDSSLDFDGTADFAGAIWLREAATVGLKAGTALNESQQRTLLNGLEVVASIWDGSK